MLSSGVDTGGKSTSKIKKCPSRGKRYSKAQKEEILQFAQANSVEEAAGKFKVTGSSIYEWRRCLKRRGGTLEGEIKIENQAEDRCTGFQELASTLKEMIPEIKIEEQSKC